MQERNLRAYNLVDTLTPSLEEGTEMRTITGDHSDPLTMTILGDDNPHLDLLTRTIVHGQDVSTTDRLSPVASKKATLEHKDNPKMQAEAKKLGKTMSPYICLHIWFPHLKVMLHPIQVKNMGNLVVLKYNLIKTHRIDIYF